MNSVVTTFFFLSAFFPSALRMEAVSTAGIAPAQVEQSVVDRADKYLKSVLAGDTSAIAGMFREDAVLMPADCPLLRGRTAIDQYYRQWLQGPAKVTAFTFNHLESPVLGDTAFDVGTYKQTLSVGNGTVNASGKYTVILKKSDGDWKIAYLIFNGDSPSPMPPTARGSR